MCVEARGQPWRPSSDTMSTLVFLRQGLSIAWNLSSRQSWLTRKHLESSSGLIQSPSYLLMLGSQTLGAVAGIFYVGFSDCTQDLTVMHQVLYFSPLAQNLRGEYGHSCGIPYPHSNWTFKDRGFDLCSC